MDKAAINNNLQAIRNYMSSNNLKNISKAEIVKIKGLDMAFKNEIINYDNYEAISRLTLELNNGLRNNTELSLADIDYAVSHLDKAQRLMTRYYSEVEYNGETYGYIVNDSPLDEDGSKGLKVVNSESLGYGLLYALEKNDETMFKNLLNTVMLLSVQNKVETDNTTFLTPWKTYITEGKANKYSFKQLLRSNDLSVRTYNLLVSQGVIKQDGSIEVDRIEDVKKIILESIDLNGLINKKQLDGIVELLKKPFPFEIASKLEVKNYGNSSASDADLDICAALIKGLNKWEGVLDGKRDLRYLIYSYARHILDQDVKYFSYVDAKGDQDYKLILSSGAMVPGVWKDYVSEENGAFNLAKGSVDGSKEKGVFYLFYSAYPSDNFIREIRDFFESDKKDRFEGSAYLYENYNRLLTDTKQLRTILLNNDSLKINNSLPEKIYVSVNNEGKYVLFPEQDKDVNESRTYASNIRVNWRSDEDLRAYNIPDREDTSYYYYLNQIKNVGKTSNVSSASRFSLYADMLYKRKSITVPGVGYDFSLGKVDLLNLSRHWGKSFQSIDSDLLASGFEVKDADFSFVSENQIQAASHAPVNVFRNNRLQDNQSSLEKAYMTYIDLSNSRTMSEVGDMFYKRLIVDTAQMAELYNKDGSDKNIYTGYMKFDALNAIERVAQKLGLDDLMVFTKADKAKRAMGGEYIPYAERINKSCVHIVSYNLDNLRNMFGYSDRQIVDEIDKMLLAITDQLGNDGFKNPIVKELYMEKMLLWDVMTDGERDVLRVILAKIDSSEKGINKIVEYLQKRRDDVSRVYNYSTINVTLNGEVIDTDKINIRQILLLPVSSSLKKLLIQEILKRDSQVAFGVSIKKVQVEEILASASVYKEMEDKFYNNVVNGHFVFSLNGDMEEIKGWLEKKYIETKYEPYRVLTEALKTEQLRKETIKGGKRELANDLNLVLRGVPDFYLSQPLSQIMYSYNFTLEERESFISEALHNTKNTSIQEKKFYMQRYLMLYQAHQQVVFQKISNILGKGVTVKNKAEVTALIKEFIELTKLTFPYEESINKDVLSKTSLDFLKGFDRSMLETFKLESKFSYISLITQSLNLMFWVNFQMRSSGMGIDIGNEELAVKSNGLFDYIDNEIPDYKNSNYKYYALKLRRDIDNLKLENITRKDFLGAELKVALKTMLDIRNHEAYVEFLLDATMLQNKYKQTDEFNWLIDRDILRVKKSDGNKAYDYIYSQIPKLSGK